MHLLQSFALLSGSKIDRPHTSLEFYPIPFDKYVVVHSGSENPSRIYDYFNDVVSHCLPFLEKEGIAIVQIGGPNDEALENTYDARGTTKRQMQYILKNALALMGNDTCSSHFASALGCKIVVLHSCLFPQNSQPYFSKPEDLVVIEADRHGNKPSFSFNENPKFINGIKPEVVAKSLMDLIGVEHDCNGFETVYMGSSYSQLAVDVIPDVEFCLPKYKDHVVNIRLDIVDGYRFLDSWADNADLNLIIKDYLDIEALKRVRNKIFAIQLDSTTSLSEKQVKEIHNLGVPVNFFVKNTTDEEFSKLAHKWFDYHINRLETKEIEIEEGVEYFFASKKLYVSEKGSFLTIADYFDNIPATKSYKPIQKGDDFWRDKEHHRIIKICQNKFPQE